MSRKIRNDSTGSHSSTDRDISLNLSNLSTTPTFSNVALHNINVVREPMSPVIPSPPAQENGSMNQTSINPTVATTGNPMQSISTYNQPMLLSTFSFSRMTSSMQSASVEAIQLPAMVEQPMNPNNISSNVSALQQPNHSSQLGYNSQQFAPPSMAVANTVTSLTNLQSNNARIIRWGSMFRGPVANNSSGLVDRRR
jgi:hypothetical protein